MDSAPELRHYLLGFLAAPTRTLTLDVGALAFMDNAGVALVYAARLDAERRGVQLRVITRRGSTAGLGLAFSYPPT